MEFCIKNVIEQHYPDVEHIIVDGGSTDGTVEVLEKYAKEYSHIRWVSDKDKGQSDAMNKGIAMAHGEILGFLNVDDYCEERVLNRIGQLMKTLPEPTLLVGNCNVWDDEGKIAQVNKPAKLKIADLMMGWNINPYPINPSQYFYHKSLHDKIGPYDINEHYTLDIDFLSRAVQAAHVKYFDEVWGNYRMIEGTKTVRDTQNGQCGPRFRATLEKHRRQLPLLMKLQVAIKRKYFFMLRLVRIAVQ